jgi:hypothetical protein
VGGAGAQGAFGDGGAPAVGVGTRQAERTGAGLGEAAGARDVAGDIHLVASGVHCCRAAQDEAMVQPHAAGSYMDRRCGGRVGDLDRTDDR